MLSMKNEECLKCMYDLFVLSHFTVGAESHFKEVGNVAQVQVRLNDGQSLVNAKTSGSNRGHLTNHSMNVYISFFLRLVAKLSTKIRGIRLWMTRRKTSNYGL
jgi:hypothetical protein